MRTRYFSSCTPLLADEKVRLMFYRRSFPHQTLVPLILHLFPIFAHINLREIDFETLMLFFTFLLYFQFPTSPAFASMWFGVWYAAGSCACWASCSSPSTFYCAPTPAPSAISRPCRRSCQPLWWVAALYDFYYRIYGNFGKPSKGRKKSQTQKFFYDFRRILPALNLIFTTH